MARTPLLPRSSATSRCELSRTGLAAAGLALAVSLLASCSCAPACTTGMAIACACPDGRTGAQICQPDGTYGVCSCTAGDAGPPDAAALDAPGEGDAPMAADAPVRRDAPAPFCARDVDWMLVVDTSNSMVEEQATLAAEIPSMVRALVTGDVDGDGTPEIEPVRSLHFGVITPDLGSGELSGVPTCDPGHGDDGILRTTPGGGAGCPVRYPDGIFEFATGDDVTAYGLSTACIARAGTGGCGFEQQLEAALKALSPSAPTAWTRPGYVAPVFHGPTSGHGEGANAGFVRHGSLLAVTLFTDEEDCSVPDYALFDPGDPRFSGVNLNLRCFTFPGELHPIGRYVDGLLQLRPDPALLVFGVIAGVPTSLVGADTVAHYDEILAAREMQEVPDPSMTPSTRLTPSCTAPAGAGVAFPPRRMVTVARDLLAAGAYTRVGSICASSYTSDLSAIVRAIAAGAPSCD